MNKKFTFLMFLCLSCRLIGMDTVVRHLDLVKLHIFNKSQHEPCDVQIFKFYMKSGPKGCEVCHYKTEEITLFTDASVTTNLRPDSYGIINIRNGQVSGESDERDSQDSQNETDSALSVVYWWDHQRAQLKTHMAQKFVDPQVLNLSPLDSDCPNSIALVLKGQRLHSSFFFYENMPEGD